MISIYDILESAIKNRASDVLLKVGAPPVLRIDGRIVPTEGERMTAEDTEELAQNIIYTSSRDHLLKISNQAFSPEAADHLSAEALLSRLHDQEEVDLVFSIPNLVRVRANLYLQQGTVAAALRIIPLQPGSLEELNLPPVLQEIANRPQGLVLVTGPTGSGKSTTLAALINHINTTRSANIVTVEDPIEYVFTDKKSMIQQREIGQDTRSFGHALRSVLRQSPDVIMIGEMRDTETIEVALTAAEVGHLVLTTLHTTGAPQTIDRIMNGFPAEKRQQISAQIAGGLLCVASQRLMPRAAGIGRIPVVEVMTASPTVKHQIETMDMSPLIDHIRESAHFGMQTFNMSYASLVNSGAITREVALENSPDAAELRQMIRG